MTHPPTDDALQERLRTGLAEASRVDSEALQDRVLAQWQQRHPVNEPVLATAGGLASHSARRPLWRVASALVLVGALAVVASWTRPDPVMEELMQLDVLSQMAMGEM
jgi:hypothetical protein